MRYSFITSVVCVSLLIACNSKQPKSKFMVELETDLSAITATRMKTADRLFELYMRDHSAGDSNEISMQVKLHTLSMKFYATADSITNSMKEIEEQEKLEIGFATLDSVYNATTDSIESLFPVALAKKGLHRSDFKESSLPRSVLLTSTRMQYDVAMNEIVVLQATAKDWPEREKNFQDDNAGVTTNRFPAPGYQYSFAVKNKFIQQFAAREIIIDSIKREGQPIAVSPVIDNRDIFRVVEFHELKKGNYMVRIGIGNSYFFPHRFQIK